MVVENMEARRRFWTDNLEASYELLSEMADYPVKESLEGLVSIREAVEEAKVEMFFSDSKLANTFDRLFYIREGVIGDLISIGRTLNEMGWILKVEEGFRTQDMQSALGQSSGVFDQVVRMCAWETSCAEPPFDLVARRSRCLVANSPCTGTHMCGAAVDISVFSRTAGVEVWRGAPYLAMSEKTPMNSPFVSSEEHANRMTITRVMEQFGFFHYPGEFWHYNSGDALSQLLGKTGKPARYGPIHWDPTRNIVTPYEDYHSPIISRQRIDWLIRSSLQRTSHELHP